MMNAREFRVAFHARDFERSVHFYEQILGMARLSDWDRADGKGVLLSAGGSAVVEIFGAAEGQAYEGEPPAGIMLAIEIDRVDEWYARLRAAGVPNLGAPENHPWGHRSFRVVDPDGLVIALYSVIGQIV